MTHRRTTEPTTSRLLVLASIGILACGDKPDSASQVPSDSAVDTDTDTVASLGWTSVTGVVFHGDGLTQAGLSLSVGDLDGDGVDELVVGQKNNCVEPDVETCASFLLLEAPFEGGRLEDAAVASFIELSESQNDEGRTMRRDDAFIGDLDGDGRQDLALLGNQDGVEGYDAYAWHLFSGPLTGSFESSTAVARVEAAGIGASPCDIDEDGQADLCTGAGVFLGPLVGDLNADEAAWRWDWSEDTPAYVARLTGSDWWGDGSGGILATLEVGDGAPPRFAVLGDDPLAGEVSWPTYWDIDDMVAYDIVGGHDLTGDGAEDFIITGALATGALPRRAIILAAPREGEGTVADIHTTFESTMRSEHREMAAAGDFDCDGHADLALSTDRGWVNIFRGPLQTGELTEEDADLILCGPETPSCDSATSCSSSDHFGYAIAAGDMDGDGCDDLVVSAPWADDDAADTGRLYIVPRAGL